MLNHVLVLGQFGGLAGNLPGYIPIGKSGAVLGFHVPIGIVSIGMGGLFPCLLFFCHHLRQAVLVVIGVFQGVAILIYRFGEVAVFIIRIALPSSLRVDECH